MAREVYTAAPVAGKGYPAGTPQWVIASDQAGVSYTPTTYQGQQAWVGDDGSVYGVNQNVLYQAPQNPASFSDYVKSFAKSPVGMMLAIATGAEFAAPGLLGESGTLGSTLGLSGSGAISGTAALPASEVGTLAAGGGLTTGGAGAAGMGGGTGLSAAPSLSTAADAGLTAGNTGLDLMGGGAGLTATPSLSAAAGAPLAAGGTALANMGGGTGLTTAAAGGGTVGASGVTGATTAADLANQANTATNAAANGDPSLLEKLKSATGLSGTQLAALAAGGVSALTSANTSAAIGQGLKAQQDATKASQDILKGIYTQQLGFQQPYQATGVNALNQLGNLGSGTYQQYDPVTGLPTTTGTGTGYLTHQFDKNDLAAGLAPNYDFMLEQGQMANQRAANVGGGALSGNTLQGLQNYTQNYAGNAYQNAFTNYQNQRNNIYTNLAGMAGIGQGANKQASDAGTSYGTGITGLNTGMANATAAALLAQANQAAGGANSLTNATFLSTLLGQTGKAPTTTPAATS